MSIMITYFFLRCIYGTSNKVTEAGKENLIMIRFCSWKIEILFHVSKYILKGKKTPAT